MIADRKREVLRLVDFLEVSVSEDVIADVYNQSSFEAMKDRFAKDEVVNALFDPKISPLIRKGQIGDWKNHFNETDNKYIDDLIMERLDGTGLVFKIRLMTLIVANMDTNIYKWLQILCNTNVH